MAIHKHHPSTYKESPAMGKCSSCGKYRQVHQRWDPATGEERILCKLCYMRERPPKRKKGICRMCFEYKELVGRELCSACYQRAHREGELEKYPTQGS